MQPEFPVDINTHRFKAFIDIQIRFDDLDGFAHINNGVQQSYFDIGRANYLRAIYGDNFYQLDKVLFIVSYKTDFLSQTTFTDSLEVGTSVYHIGDKSLKMIQILRSKIDGRICTVSDSTMVSVDARTRQSIPFPDEWRRVIERIEAQ
ncbi:MAG: acyl-CoA thioesterase [Bacteroidales bacterium]|nr:acyl-CoA thioesterase [Bacteroidales bacterium]